MEARERQRESEMCGGGGSRDGARIGDRQGETGRVKDTEG